jgi:hypothetical protein
MKANRAPASPGELCISDQAVAGARLELPRLGGRVLLRPAGATKADWLLRLLVGLLNHHHRQVHPVSWQAGPFGCDLPVRIWAGGDTRAVQQSRSALPGLHDSFFFKQLWPL